MAREIARAGHELGIHGYSHRDLSILPWREMRREIDTTRLAIEAATERHPRLLRPPYGKWSIPMVTYAASNGFTLVFWSVDPEDVRQGKAPREIVKGIEACLRGGDIILLHETSTATLDALPHLIDVCETVAYSL